MQYFDPSVLRLFVDSVLPIQFNSIQFNSIDLISCFSVVNFELKTKLWRRVIGKQIRCKNQYYSYVWLIDPFSYTIIFILFLLGLMFTYMIIWSRKSCTILLSHLWQKGRFLLIQ